jgi:hypothetical protein
MRAPRWLLVLVGLLAPSVAIHAQDRGAVRLDQQIRGLTVTARVLIVGAHPDDEDGRLIAFLARGHGIETAYLSLTRGEGGQNFVGGEAGDGLGAIRTGELLAARALDGGHQFFTRAFDFGLSKTADETYAHWPHDALLNDVVSVIRSFRPHVVIALFTGTAADSDGHHAVSALLAREAFDVAGDTVTFPIAKFGFPWQPAKLYGPGTGLTIDVGGYDAVPGRTLLEVADESRAQRRSQGFADSLRSDSDPARRLVTLRRIASRVTAGTGPEQSLFDGVDTTFAHLADSVPNSLKALLANVRAYADSARDALDLRHPEAVVSHLAHAARWAAAARNSSSRCLHPSADASAFVSSRAACGSPWPDLDASLDIVKRRASQALLTAAAISIDARADRELLAYSDSMPVTLTVANHGRDSVQLITVTVSGAPSPTRRPAYLQPDSVASWTVYVSALPSGAPWWFGRRTQDLYPDAESAIDGVARGIGPPGLVTRPAVTIPEDLRRTSDVVVTLRIAGELVTTSVGPIVHRVADASLGIQDRPVGGVPSITLAFEGSLEWVPTGKPLDRALHLTVRSFADSARRLSFKVVAPPGVRVDSLPRSITMQAHERREMVLRLRGALKVGMFEFGVVATDPGEVEFAEGFRTIQYPHLLPIRMSRASGVWLKGVDIVVPPRLSVGYIQGVGDAIAQYMRQLGVSISTLGTDELLNADLSVFTTIVVGARAYEAHPELIAYNPKLLDFVRRGGTLVVQGQTRYDLGVFPYLLDGPPNGSVDRVTVESAPVTVVPPTSRLLTWPNKIDEHDWSGWVIERTAYMPRIIDPRYITPLEMHDPGEPESRGALVVASIGKGTYIYTTLALHKQLGGAVSGSARLFVNLLSAGLTPDTKRIVRR